MTEHQLCNQIIEFLGYHGVYCWRENAGLTPAEYKGKKRMIRLGFAGKSDIIGVTKTGRFVALEVKLPSTRSRVTHAQLDFLQKITDHGGIAGVVTGCDEALHLINT